MSKMMTTPERIAKARQLIVDARQLQAPDSAGWEYFSYTAQVKDLLKQAFELVKLIQYSPAASAELKAETRMLIESLPEIEREILKPDNANKN